MNVENPNKAQIAVADLFNALADQFSRLAQRSSQLERTIQDISLSSDNSVAQRIVELQDLDYISQALQDLDLLACGIRDCAGTQSITINSLSQIVATLHMADSKHLLDPFSGTARQPARDQSGETIIF